MRLEVLREIPEDEDLRRRWNALVEQVDQPQVFYTYEWALAVQRAYSRQLRPLVFFMFDGNDGEENLCGVAALATDTSGESVSFLCATTADYCDFISLPGERDAFVAAVLAKLRRERIRKIIFTNLPADSPSLSALQMAVPSHSYRLFSRTAYICAQVSLAALPRRGANIPVLPRKKMLRRFLNAMGREAPVRLDHARSWEETKAVLPGFIEAHIARFLVTGRISNLVRSERRVFLEQLARLLSQRGWFVLTTFAAGQKVFAWNFGFRFSTAWFWYQPTFDSDFEKYSPGFCLLAKLIEEAADIPDLQTVDLGLGAEEYKERFANQTRETLYVTLNSSFRNHMREVARHYLAVALKKEPSWERAARSMIARGGMLRGRLRASGTPGTVRWAAHRIRTSFSGRDEVFFYELTNPAPELLASEEMAIQSLNLNTLASAAVQNESDPATLAYLLRCAQHLQKKDWAGFALTDRAGEFLHFTWAGLFEIFHWSELGSHLRSPAPNSMVLFDSWTPISQRGKGYYAPTIAMVANKIREEGKRSWGFSASTNTSSVRGLEKAGFKRSFSVVRYRALWWQKVVQGEFTPD